MPAGIALRGGLDQGAPAALLAAGICDAASAGVLLYVALAELLPAMTASSWLRSQRWPLQVCTRVCGRVWLRGGVGWGTRAGHAASTQDAAGNIAGRSTAS